MRSLVALTDLRYAGKDLTKGHCFDAESDSDAFVLKAAGKAEDAPHRQRQVKTRAMKADDADRADDGAPGRYRRSDMRAED